MKPVNVPWLLLMLGLIAQLWAQAAPQLTLQVEENKVNLTAAEKAGRTPVKITRGDTIRYVITAKNIGTSTITEPVITDPLPAGVIYLPNSAKGTDTKILFSIDGGKTYYPWPVIYTAKDKDGKTITKTATPEMVTHVRWEIQKPLPAKATKQVEFKVTVK